MPPRAEAGRRAPLPRGVTHLPTRVPLGQFLRAAARTQHGVGVVAHLSAPPVCSADTGPRWTLPHRSAPIGLITITERIQSLDPGFTKFRRGGWAAVSLP